MSTASYLDRLLEPVTNFLTPDMARALCSMRASPDLEADLQELRRKANEGTLTPDEDAQYKEFVEALDLVSILQSKARQFLAKYPS